VTHHAMLRTETPMGTAMPKAEKVKGEICATGERPLSGWGRETRMGTLGSGPQGHDGRHGRETEAGDLASCVEGAGQAPSSAKLI
jgi:hypothetical protein